MQRQREDSLMDGECESYTFLCIYGEVLKKELGVTLT